MQKRGRRMVGDVNLHRKTNIKMIMIHVHDTEWLLFHVIDIKYDIPLFMKEDSCLPKQKYISSLYGMNK